MSLGRRIGRWGLSYSKVVALAAWTTAVVLLQTVQEEKSCEYQIQLVSLCP